jgi:hypothetical protein
MKVNLPAAPPVLAWEGRMANNVNLERLRKEMLEHLHAAGLVVFHSQPRAESEFSAIYWDTQGHPDFREFVAAAAAAGAKMLTLYSRDFEAGLIEDLMDRLEDSDLDRDERRAIESRLRELRAYEGFTCELELSFDLGDRVYVFERRTDWYENLLDLMDEIEMFEPGDEPMGGYLSKN